jgi:hypothetical protein
MVMALIYETSVPQSYRADFIAKVKEISEKLKIDPNWLMAIMNFESARTFSPSEKNQIGCVGLIQFCPDAKGLKYKTIRGKRYTLDQISKMTAVEQLDLVYEYLKQYTGKINSYIDTYFAIFFPLAIGKPDDWIIQGGGLTAQKIYDQNPAFRKVKDGKLRVWEVKSVMLSKLPKEWLNDGSFSLAVKTYKNQLLIGLALILSGYLIYKNYLQKK